MDAPIYKIAVKTIRGKAQTLARYKGKVMLIVNTASECGFTPQYKGLEELHQSLGKRGLAVLGFPCNQFGAQEPGEEAAIASFCEINYGVTFPIFAKVEVNGPGAHPLFQYLTTALPGFFGKRIRWNFTKFLIARDGTPLRRYAPATKPPRLVRHIEKALAKK